MPEQPAAAAACTSQRLFSAKSEGAVFICCGQPARRTVAEVDSNAAACGGRTVDNMNTYSDVNNLDPRKDEEVSGNSGNVAWPSQKGGLYQG